MPTLVPEPQSKRKTTEDRLAGSRTLPPPSTSQSSSTPSNSDTPSLAGLRNASFSASVSSKPSNSLSRPVYGRPAVGASSRPPSQSHLRPQTSMKFRPDVASARTPAPVSRPASSLDNHSSTDDRRVVGKRKGMIPISIPASRSNTAMQDNTHSPCIKLSSATSKDSSPLAFTTPSTAKPCLLDSFEDLSLSNVCQRRKHDAVETNRPATAFDVSHPFRHSSAQKYLRQPVFVTPANTVHKKKIPFLTRDSNTLAIEWDVKGRLADIEHLYSEMQKTTAVSAESMSTYKARINELEAMQTHLNFSNMTLQNEAELSRSRISTLTAALDDERRSKNSEIDQLRRQHSLEFDRARKDAGDEISRLHQSYKEKLADLDRHHKIEVENQRTYYQRDLQGALAKIAAEKGSSESKLDQKNKELKSLKLSLEDLQSQLSQERALRGSLQSRFIESSTNTLALETALCAAKSKVDALGQELASHLLTIAGLEKRLSEAIEQTSDAVIKLRKEEGLRRKLHNQVQELKGNIRVFCRVRPPLESDPTNDLAAITYPDAGEEAKEMEIQGLEEKSSLGSVMTKSNGFSFDRVFGPSCQNDAVFEEISQLVQSALDGYNVCVFAYGQSGSGKSYTMGAEDGMIPRAVHQIYDTAKSLENKGWTYVMEGSFVEVYNETLNDLLGRPEDFDKKKHEIRNDLAKNKTLITDLTIVSLDSSARVESILSTASANRTVAETKANNRSSRSHSVFILRLIGSNAITGEKSEGTLNLVDLAGSERLSHSGSTGDRLKETQNINRSLSCLGDVISALGQGKEGGHIPYRNSKLTHLLQFSLGGNSKTLMFVMVSPLKAHLNETISSLKFATKVHNTHIGTAKKQTKYREP
ncbi:MAG: kinesin-like nuclear fusion protein [Trizodia sp. TS-e1964]|nr:MAG: kinesin-like nuclear fusion protein [Trizodia sp. TS-e1964]